MLDNMSINDMKEIVINSGRSKLGIGGGITKDNILKLQKLEWI